MGAKVDLGIVFAGVLCGTPCLHAIPAFAPTRAQSV